MTPEDFGRFDVVYAWGVLHHTGAMWDAIRRAGALVADEGFLAMAIYLKTRFCGLWRREKRVYSRSPKMVQIPLRVLFIAAATLREVLEGRNPFPRLSDHWHQQGTRGMRLWNDAHDWLGGYPYESASPKEVEDFVSNLGLRQIRSLGITPNIGLFGSGCAQYLFKRNRGQRR